MATTYTPAEAFSPGEILRDELEERGWTETEFAQIIDRPLQAVSEILNAKKAVTADTAMAIGAALDTSAELWLNLQANYSLAQAREGAPDLTPVERRSRLRSVGPVAEMRRRRWISDTDDLDVLESDMKSLYGDDLNPGLAFAARRVNATEALSAQQLAWLMFVRHVADRRCAEVAMFDIERLRALGASLCRRLLPGPNELGQLRDWLAECGVVLVVEPGLKGGKFDGVAMLSTNGTPVIGVTGRYNRLDILVFTILHEIAHFVLGHVTTENPYMIDDLDNAGTDINEVQANELAGEWIFPGGFVAPAPATSANISRYARTVDVPVSMVIGRLMRDGKLRPTQFRNHLRKVRPYIDAETQWPK
jgi:HTH-type transcriptional regulator / antitoxin HigA